MPVKHKDPELRPASAAIPQATCREKTIKWDPDDIIDLTLSSSGIESLGALDEEPSSIIATPYGETQSGPTNPTPPSSERTHGETSIHGFSTGSTILGPTLNLVKEPYDKPRLFVRYVLDFEACLANVSAHGFVDRVYMVSRW